MGPEWEANSSAVPSSSCSAKMKSSDVCLLRPLPSDPCNELLVRALLLSLQHFKLPHVVEHIEDLRPASCSEISRMDLVANTASDRIM